MEPKPKIDKAEIVKEKAKTKDKIIQK